VRIPTAMNRFLDAHGVLDADYEQAAQRNARFAALLLPDRTPTALAGNALVIIDSSEMPGLQGSTTTPNQVSAPAEPSRPPIGVNAKSRVERRTIFHRSHRFGSAAHRHQFGSLMHRHRA
jgi:hypothetical protein